MNNGADVKREFYERLRQMRRQIEDMKSTIDDAQGDALVAAEGFERLFDVARSLSDLVEVKDTFKKGHHRRVADLGAAIADKLNLSADQVRGIRLAGILHDVGKIAIDEALLAKKTKYTAQEFEHMKIHVQAGIDLIRDLDFPWPVVRMMMEHHERMNGSGYPHGLKGESLLLESRILAVADVVDAIASNRPYRPAFSIDTALYDLTGERGRLYDADVVEVCLSLFREGYQMLDTED